MEPTPEQQQRAREMIEQWDTADRSGGWGLMRIEKQKLTDRIAAALAEAGGAQGESLTPLLRKIVEICDEGSALEFNDANERLRAIRGMIIREAV